MKKRSENKPVDGSDDTPSMDVIRAAIARITKATGAAVAALNELAQVVNAHADAGLPPADKEAVKKAGKKSVKKDVKKSDKKADTPEKPAKATRGGKPETPKNAGRLTSEQLASKARKAPRRTPDGVFMSDSEVTVFAGAYVMKAIAEREAQEFLNTDVLRNRSALFPDFRRYGILPTVASARVVPAESDAMRPWRLLATVELTGGSREARLAWAGDVVGRCRAFTPSK